MSLAETLLDSLPGNAYQMPRIGGSGYEEGHIVVNENIKIIVPDNLKTIGVEWDKDIETIAVDCIRYWDGHDLSTFDIHINVILPNNDEVTYTPSEIIVRENYFSFYWVIGRDITIQSGSISFSIIAKITNSDGEDLYQWSSLQNDECSIARGGGKIHLPDEEEQESVETNPINQVRIVDEGSVDTDNSHNIEKEHILVCQNREIIVPDNIRVIAVKGDKNVETVTIDCIRFWKGYDFSTFATYINYRLPNGEEGTYIPEKIVVKENVFSFNWLIGRHVTSYVGTFSFWIVTRLTDDEGNLERQWSSFPNNDFLIAQGGDKFYVPEDQTDKDVISQVISISTQSAIKAEKSAELASNAQKAAEEAEERSKEAAKRAEEISQNFIIKTDKTLSFENRVLSVNTVDDLSDNSVDKSLPITASAVEVTLGNIEALLETI